MHVAPRQKFDLVLGERLFDEKYRSQYLDDDTAEATVVLINTRFRVAARAVDQQATVLSDGGFDDVTFTFKVLNTATGKPIGEEQDRVSIKPNGELLGEFSAAEIGKFTVIVTAVDGGGESFQLEPFMLDVRQLDIDVPGHGPNNKGCANKGVPVDDSGDRFDGAFTSCDCTGIALHVGENCDKLCPKGTMKSPTSAKCVNESTIGALSVALGIVGSVSFTFLLLAGAFWLRQRRVRMRPFDFDDLNRKMMEDGSLPCNQNKPRELTRSTVTLLQKVGSGSFGAVWKAVLDESARTGRPEYHVAAKTVRESAPTEARDDLATEATVMAQLAGHKNLVSIIGVVTVGTPLILVLSYCDHGSLQCHLKRRAGARKAVSREYKLDFAAQTARGMEHLSGRQFVHRDLAARNVLLTSGQSKSTLVCKVADFGLSRSGTGGKQGTSTENEVYYRSSKGVFPVRWTAPEAMETLVFNRASDVWSFGVVLVELVQDGGKPYHEITSNSDVVALTLSGRKHKQPHGCSSELYKTMLRCWDVKPRKRPCFTELATKLEQLCINALVWGEDIYASDYSLDETPVSDDNNDVNVAAATAGYAAVGSKKRVSGSHCTSRSEVVSDEIQSAEPVFSLV
jgi:serine/threonine protein kinase